MIRFTIFLALRAVTAVFCLLTATYAVVCYSPFAFDMFVRPQLFAWLTHFVQWHHLWYWPAYAAGVATLVPVLVQQGSGRHAAAVRRLALGYVVAFALVGVGLVMSPYLPTIWGDRRTLAAVPWSCVPLLWLAVVDHLATGSSEPARPAARAGATSQHHLLAASAATAVVVWLAHLLRAMLGSSGGASGSAWVLSSAWTLVLVAAVFTAIYTLLAFVSAVAASTRAPRASEFWMLTAVAAVAFAEFLRRAVFPTILLDGAASAAVAAAASLTFAAMWSGLVRRRPGAAEAATGLELLLMPAVRPPAALALLAAFVAGASVALTQVERQDWEFLAQKLVVITAWAGIFGVMLRLIGRPWRRAWSLAATAAPPLAVLALVYGVPWPEAALNRGAVSEIGFRLASDAVVRRSSFDPDYFRFLQANTYARPGARPTMPDADFAATPARSAARPPDVFLLVIDSLRRDYLSPYNPAVTFTPNIARFAAEAFVFRNAFTRYGATQLAIPSIWSGSELVRQFGVGAFDRINAIEKLVKAEGYRIAINDFTVRTYLRPDTPVTDIDPGIKSVDTDLCQNLASLRRYLDEAGHDRPPVMGFFAPMNVHMLNTRDNGGQEANGGYAGFYAPYASRLRRIDACFGDFVSYLKQRGTYDNSVIIITGDHGDSLGEEGRWGHSTWLFPEDIRLPLIVKVPADVAPTITTDLARVAFTTDIAPTLYALAGQRVADLGPHFGSPLFVAADTSLPSRRRESYLLMSSYGATYALLRRNGRFLYVSDLGERREFAFDLAKEPVGEPAEVTDELRRVAQRMIRERVAAVNAFFRFNP